MRILYLGPRVARAMLEVAWFCMVSRPPALGVLWGAGGVMRFAGSELDWIWATLGGLPGGPG